MLILSVFFILILASCLIGVLLGAPYLPTLNKQIEAALDLANITEGQTLIELGCGDGRVLIAAAKRGAKSIGYEINPILVLIARLRLRKYQSHSQVIWGNYWSKKWPEADAIFVFLISRYMNKLDSYIKDYQYKPISLVSFAFKIPEKEITKTKDDVYLYSYE